MSTKIVDLSSIGGRIAFVRGEMRQEDFAEKMGVSRKTAIRYEKGESSPDALFLARLVEEFGVNATWLLVGEEHPTIQFTPREVALLENFRRCPEDAQRNVEGMVSLLAQPRAAGKKKAG